MEHSYIAIDLKSFYASVECARRSLDPISTNLVVADPARTEKTICLAVSPALKRYGIPGRARLFEVIQKVKAVNAERKHRAPDGTFRGKSSDANALDADPSLELDFVVAPPHMADYMAKSAEIYSIYLKFIAPEDMHVYSIDEVFIDATSYLDTYRLTPSELARKMILAVLKQTGITATAGIGPNLYLAKIAMDVYAKHIPEDENGVRIAELDEQSYRRKLWTHEPLTDFWRVGRGYMKKLHEVGIYTMGDIARCSVGKPNDFHNEELLYRLFGVNAELLIDHAWGWEPCTMEQIRSYQPENNSVGSGQVLPCPYDTEMTRMVVKEMADQLSFQLLEKYLVTSQLVLTVGYDIGNLTDPERRKNYNGPLVTDRYGRKLPKHAHGAANLKNATSSSRLLTEEALKLFDRIIDPSLMIRRLYLTATKVVPETDRKEEAVYEQLDLFTDYEELEREKKEKEEQLSKERRLQEAMLSIRNKFGKNAILKGTSLQDGATAKERNGMLGGHRK